ncbi:unnamed protein product [Calicophoron daubneyi]|uniref:Uncharacterized protein n=1 Tax=Calicophoron daubneyi TaxID=300641 RepID=A0AAV2TKJ1_CALDB
MPRGSRYVSRNMPTTLGKGSFEEAWRQEQLSKRFISQWNYAMDGRGQPPQPLSTSQPAMMNNTQPASTQPAMNHAASTQSVTMRQHSPIILNKSHVSRISQAYESQLYDTSPDLPRSEMLDVLYSNMPDEWQRRASNYINAHWERGAEFASIYPLLLKLEKERGPGWRLDEIKNPKTVAPDAVGGSTFNFSFPKERAMYSVWRQRVPEF